MIFKALCIIPRGTGGIKLLRVMRSSKARSHRTVGKSIVLAMKLTAILLFSACLQVSAKGYSQGIHLDVTSAPLQKIFAEIKHQTGYLFFYTDGDLRTARPVSIHADNLSLSEALDLVFKNQPLTYTVIEKTVIVKLSLPPVPKAADAALLPHPPPTDIHGHITDSLGNPLAGASVTVKGSNKGTTTNAKGDFDLKGIDNNATLLISFTGYETQQIKLNGRNEVAIQLKQAVSSLQDVVVNKGYYSVRQRENTGNVSIVDSKTIQEQPVSDPIQALIGRIPGLDIQQNSGIPGAYATVRIRGQNSIANGNVPLYIIDGVPFSAQSLSSVGFGNSLGFGSIGTNGSGTGQSPFSALNPADIENIEVLKDADATAIYGSRGANGVILITTKKGKAGDTRFNFEVSQGVGQVGHMMDLLNTQQYLQMRREAFKNDGMAVPSIISSPTDNNYDVNGVWDTTRYTNWQKVMIGNKAQYTNIQASISGGNENTQFLVGGGYNRQTTVFPGNFEDGKASVHLNLTHSSNDQKFHTQFAFSYISDNNLLPGLDYTPQSTLAPDAPALYNPDGSINWQVRNGTFTFFNPLGLTKSISTAKTNNLIGNVDLSYKVLTGLMLKSNFGYSHEEMNENVLLPATIYPPPYNANPIYRSFYFGNTTFQTWNIEPQLSYQRRIAKGQLNILLGTTFQQNQQQSTSQQASVFASDALITNPQAASVLTYLNSPSTLYRYNAIYIRIGYDWNEKYLLNITARRDGSSRFGPGRRFGNFGAIGAGWIFSKEKITQEKAPWLSFGKIRGSYGITGNDQLTDYQYLSTYTPGSTSYQGTTQLSPTSLTNPTFGWETVIKLEGGLDLGFLKDRVNLSVNYYRNRTGNQLVGYPLPSVAGFSSIQYNLPAIVQNTGLEIELNTVNFRTKGFNWTTSATFTLPQNELVSYPDIAKSGYRYYYVVGQSLFIKKLYQFTGVDPQTGIYTYGTQNVNGVPGLQDLIVGPAYTRKYYGGIKNTFSYKGIALDVFFQFVKQLGYNFQTAFPAPGTYNANEPTSVMARWQNPGDVTNVGRFGTTPVSQNPYYLLRASTAFSSDASFIRLKNLAFSYYFPIEWQHWAHIQNAKIYLQAQNLLTITNYPGLDPETQGMNLPPLRMVTIGLSTSF